MCGNFVHATNDASHYTTPPMHKTWCDGSRSWTSSISTRCPCPFACAQLHAITTASCHHHHQFTCSRVINVISANTRHVVVSEQDNNWHMIVWHLHLPSWTNKYSRFGRRKPAKVDERIWRWLKLVMSHSRHTACGFTPHHTGLPALPRSESDNWQTHIAAQYGLGATTWIETRGSSHQLPSDVVWD